MTVSELIKALSEMDQNATVVMVVDVPGPEIDIDLVEASKGYYSGDNVVELS